MCFQSFLWSTTKRLKTRKPLIFDATLFFDCLHLDTYDFGKPPFFALLRLQPRRSCSHFPLRNTIDPTAVLLQISGWITTAWFPSVFFFLPSALFVHPIIENLRFKAQFLTFTVVYMWTKSLMTRN